jgi:hypothetical protein
MPWLEPVEVLVADELAARLGFAQSAQQRLGDARTDALAAEGAADPSLRELRAILDAMLEDGRQLPFFGGIDMNPANVLCTPDGQLKLIDPIYVAGREIIAALQRDADAVARRIAPVELRAWLQIACFENAASDPDFQKLVAIVDALEDG